MTPPHAISLSGTDERIDQVGPLVDEFTAAGYRELWTSELNGSDAFAPLLAAAVRRPWLRLGTAVACVFTRSPALLAMQALSLAEASEEPVLEPMWQAWAAGDRKAALAAVPDALVDEPFLTGDEAQIRAGVAEYVKAGITRPVLSVMGPGPEYAHSLALRLGSATD